MELEKKGGVNSSTLKGLDPSMAGSTDVGQRVL